MGLLTIGFILGNEFLAGYWKTAFIVITFPKIYSEVFWNNFSNL